jgi:hypothetical protein
MEYAIFYAGFYFGPLHHEHKVSDIQDARVFSREEGLQFIKKVSGAILRPIQ